MRAAVYRAKAHDLARIVDPLRALEIPTRVRRDERVEGHRCFALPDDGKLVTADVYGKAHDLAVVVNGVTTRGPGRDGAFIPAEVLHTGLLGPQEGVFGASCRIDVPADAGESDYIPAVIDTGSNVINARWLALQVAQVSGRAVAVPEHGVRGERPEGGQIGGVGAQTRRADGLAAVVDPRDKSNGIAGGRLQFLDPPAQFPANGFKTKNLKSLAAAGAGCIACAILRNPYGAAQIVHVKGVGVMAARQGRESRQAPNRPDCGETLMVSAIPAKVLAIRVHVGRLGNDRGLGRRVHPVGLALQVVHFCPPSVPRSNRRPPPNQRKA